MNEIVLAFVINITGGGTFDVPSVPFSGPTAMFKCIQAAPKEALRVTKELESRGIEAVIHYSCGPKVEERHARGNERRSS